MFLGTALEFINIEVELLIGQGGFIAYQTQTNSECYIIYPGVRLWVLTSIVKRETTQTAS